MELFVSGLVVSLSLVLIAGLLAAPGLILLLLKGSWAIEDEQDTSEVPGKSQITARVVV